MSCQVLHHPAHQQSHQQYYPSTESNSSEYLDLFGSRKRKYFEKTLQYNEKYIDFDSELHLKAKSDFAAMNTNHTESVRPPGLEHSLGPLAGYEPIHHAGLNNGGSGSPYLSSHGHNHHHHHIHPSHESLSNLSSHSVAALQRLSSTLEPSGETNGGEHPSRTNSIAQSYHHQRTSSTPPSHQSVSSKIRKHQQHEEDDIGSGSDAGEASGQPPSLPDEDEGDSQVGRAQYLTANCVVFTYFRGDISQVVDDHFSRALSQTSDKSKDCVPLSQRNFPASFWISNYQYPIGAGSSSFSSFAHDLYQHHAHAHHAAAAAAAADPYAANSLLSADVDPWQNYMAAAAGSAYSAAHHRAAHDMYHTSRLNPQYSSFLLQSSAAMRQAAHGRAAAALGKAPHDSWAAAAAVASVGSAAAGQALESYTGSTHAHYGGMTGLEGTMQSSSKDLYWF